MYVPDEPPRSSRVLGERTLVEQIRASWHTKLGLALSWLLALLVSVSVAAVLPEKSFYLSVVLFAVIALVAAGKWTLDRRLKKCPNGKVGFLLAISVDDADTYKLFKRDFIHNIEHLLLQSGVGQKIWVGEVPQWRLEKAPSMDDAIALRSGANCTFVLFGQVRTRQGERRQHYIDLSGVVAHAETEEHNTTKLRNEFSELLPRRIIADEGSELPTFEMTSALSSMVAKYIAGIGAYLSGSLDAAEALYKDAANIARASKDAHEISRKIWDRLPVRQTELVITRARSSYQKWRESREDSDLVEMGRELARAPEAGHVIPEWRTLQAISLVVTAGADLDQIERLVKSGHDADPVTHMNLAFFDLLRGDLKAAARHYRNADSRNVSMDTIDEVMSFLDWFKVYRPQYWCEVEFALGFIGCHLLKDRDMAAASFDEFERLRGPRFDVEARLIGGWLGAQFKTGK